MKVVIIGGGIIGAALAHNLLRAGADVTVIAVGIGATGASFGWINASFYLDAAHFRLRAAGLEAWRRLDVPVNWSGALCWEKTGAAFGDQYAALTALGYPVQIIDDVDFTALEPHVPPPARALRFSAEGMIEPDRVARTLLTGARQISGVAAIGIATRAGHVTGVETAQGEIDADRVIVAAGCHSGDLLKTVGVRLPLIERPGVLLRTHSVPPRLAHVLVTPEGEVRQDAAGHIWMPTAAQHQTDAGTTVEERPDILADRALVRLQGLLPNTPLKWEQVMLAQRPMPQDGHPVIGACGPEGLFVATMHSGVTLAAITAELLAPQILDRKLSNAQSDMVAPYSPERFQIAVM
jgi:D-hydroxyproline dehydrogenase subunit beta